MSLYTGFDLKSYGYSVIPKSMTAEDRKLLSSLTFDETKLCEVQLKKKWFQQHPSDHRSDDVTCTSHYCLSPDRLVVFHDCDSNNKGYLTREDTKIAVVSLYGYKPSKYEVNQLLDKYGESLQEDVKVLTLAKFIDAMAPKLSTQDENEEIRQTFLAFDTQCRGFLTVEDLKKTFGQVAPHLPIHAVAAAFKELDRDGDGRISYRDFDFMMKYGKDS